jgi:hypothetical protein
MDPRRFVYSFFDDDAGSRRRRIIQPLIRLGKTVAIYAATGAIAINARLAGKIISMSSRSSRTIALNSGNKIITLEREH